MQSTVSKDKIKAKALGAFYTDRAVAKFLVDWAIRSANDRIIDPSFGGAVFLEESCERLISLGGQCSSQVYGIEIDKLVHEEVASHLFDTYRLPPDQLVRRDFFAINPSLSDIPPMNVVLGNPPYIRYQRFKGTTRRRALQRAYEHGVSLSQLSSSWAPFLVASVGLLQSGGRLAMVLPKEITQATYAIPVLRHLANSFESIFVLTFQERLFPELEEETVVILAEKKGGRTSNILVRDFRNVGELTGVRPDRINKAKKLFSVHVDQSSKGLTDLFISGAARCLYEELATESAHVQPLSSLMDVRIGYVTGNNRFFHLSPSEVREWKIPDRFLRRAIRRGRNLKGLFISESDWRDGLSKGDSCYLLAIDPKERRIPKGLREYLENGEDLGVSSTYKCRERRVWYSVPQIIRPDAFLTYMNGNTSRIISNDCDLVASNSLHILRSRPLSSVSPRVLALLWQTSLTRLSMELEGHTLGGGMLKLEPSEAERVIVACPENIHGSLTDVCIEVDDLLRAGSVEKAQDICDRVILKKGLGLSNSDCRFLREAANTLRERRSR